MKTRGRVSRCVWGIDRSYCVLETSSPLSFSENVNGQEECLQEGNLGTESREGNYVQRDLVETWQRLVR